MNAEDPYVGYDPTAAPQTGSDDMFEVDLSTEAPIAAGTYAAQLTDLFKDVSSTGNDMFVWEFTIGEGPELGKTLRAYTALSKQAAWKLAQVVRGMGLPMEGNTARFTAKQAIGRWAMIVVTQSNYQGQMRSNIDNVKQWPAGRPFPSNGAPS